MNNEELSISNQQLVESIKEKDGQAVGLSPNDNLDFNFKTTENVWGKAGSITPELKAKLLKITKIMKDEKGNVTAEYESLWDQLGYFTRDLRLSNLDSNGYNRVVMMLDLAGDYLSVNYKDAFILCLSRVASIVEVSQSKKGFLREILNTIFQKTQYSGLNGHDNKRSLITGGVSKDKGGK